MQLARLALLRLPTQSVACCGGAKLRNLKTTNNLSKKLATYVQKSLKY